MKVRLQKFLSDAGVASRRHAEDLILDGRVLVNDRIVDQLPAFVDPQRDRVLVSGTLVRVQKLEYWIVNKPKGVVSTNRDPSGRTRVLDLLPELPVRLFPVGRLDVDSTGLLLLTNDGELTEHLTHPRYGIPRTYICEVRGRVTDELPQRMRAGVRLAEGKARAQSVDILHASQDRSALRITLTEGMNREVRRMLAKLGYPVKKLRREQFGPLSLHKLPLGAVRRLEPREVDELRRTAEEAVARARQRPPARRARTRASAPRRGAQSTPAAPAPTPGRRIVT